MERQGFNMRSKNKKSDEVTEMEVTMIRDMLGSIYNHSKYLIYNDEDNVKKNRKKLKKLLKYMDNNEMEDVIYELFE